MTKRIIGLSTLLSVSLLAAPAFAQSRGVVVLTPGGGSSATGTQQQPTSFLSTETARVLPNGLGYFSTGATFGGGTVNYQRGMGGGGELDVMAGLNLAVGGATTFGAGVGAGWKQSFSDMLAVNGGVFVGGIGATTTISAMVGVPLTFGMGMGGLHVHPRVTFPSLTAGTAGATVGAAVGYQAPVAERLSLLAEVVPQMGLTGGPISLPIGLGVRFSPTATSAVDFSLANVAVTPGFGATLGLLGVNAHVGF